MPILFGWGRTTKKVFGPVFKHMCSHCHNEEYWILTRVRVWFTLFFIPIFPYENKYYLSCPICEYGMTLNSEQINTFVPIAEVNQLLVDGHITKEEYQRRVVALNGETTPALDETKIYDVEPEMSTSDENDTEKRFCSQCGKQVPLDTKFCGSCGASTSK